MTNKEAIKILESMKTDLYDSGVDENDIVFGRDMKAINLAIKALEEKPTGEWIPVSDRLPEYSGLYLISIYDLVTVANFTGEYFCDRQMDKFVDVFAWQPLPEPYKEGDDKNV